ncbi:MAG: hypothetical protein Ct9H300mP1_38290 [Planctomycetaceae bacterium]|nr:MAG: hypothetical protein Ct9H300mP1_38290 [Planctomycetaceae bacterium]
MVEIFVGDMSLEIPPGGPTCITRPNTPCPSGNDPLGPPSHAPLGRRCRSWAVLPNGRKVPLVAVDDWDFNWQGQYHLRKPLKLPAGTRLVHSPGTTTVRATRSTRISTPAGHLGRRDQRGDGIAAAGRDGRFGTDRTKLIRHNWSHFAEQYRRLSGSR